MTQVTLNILTIQFNQELPETLIDVIMSYERIISLSRSKLDYFDRFHWNIYQEFKLYDTAIKQILSMLSCGAYLKP